MSGEGVLRQLAFALALVSDAIAVLIVAAAVVMAAWRMLRDAPKKTRHHPWASVRLDLARSLALALEFMLAGDVVRTAVAPEWDDIGKLAALAVIRTGLNVFLQRDLQKAPPAGECLADDNLQGVAAAP